MTIYKVRRGEQVLEVEGFSALVKLAQDGELRPDDAVFVPASNRWHYARSIRQLREHFPQVEDPPPPSGKVREMPIERAPAAAALQQENEDTGEATRVADGNGSGNGAAVVPLRRGRWTPEGKGVQVPVFNYDLDVEPPKAVKPLRYVVSVGIALAAGGMIYAYQTSYARYLEREAERVERLALEAPPPAPPDAAPPRTVESAGRAGEPEATAATAATDASPVAAVASAPVPAATETPVPLPHFDAEGARGKVIAASLGRVSRPDELAAAMKSDLIKLAVPVRSVQLVAPKKAGKGPVPFDVVVDYASGDDVAAATRAKHYWMISAMVGRRANELRLNLRGVTVRSFKGDRKVSQAVLTADAVRAVANGTVAPETLLSGFPDLRGR